MSWIKIKENVFVFYSLKLILLIYFSNLTFGNINNDKSKYSDYIVQFRRFLSDNERINIIKFTLQYQNESWILSPRPYKVLFSDFENIKILDGKFKDISNQLYSYKIVKSIIINTKIIGRKLSFLNNQKSNGHKIVSYLQADLLWSMGIKGQGVRVGIFDTGIDEDHPHFTNANIEYTHWTNEPPSKDTNGHGTFVAGIFVSDPEDDQCPRGISPNVDLYVFRLFTRRQISYTSWFLDAFNYAMAKRIDLINLSIGGPDFHDLPFVHKVWELSANGILMISAIGNDGPLYGTLNNPADQLDVIGVGGLNFDNKVSRFSSRGMTTWELPYGYGRPKPDIVTYGSQIVSSSLNGGCRQLSGTSVASPTVAAVIALLISAVKVVKGDSEPNPSPASIKQAIMSSATRLSDTNANMFEQGMGKLNLIGAYRAILESRPQLSAYPSYIDLTEDPYMWPYSAQPLFSTAMPIIINITIINSISLSGAFVGPPVYHAILSRNGEKVQVSISHSTVLWPWTGFIAIELTVKEEYSHWEGITEGFIMMEIESWDSNQRFPSSQLRIPLRTKVIPTPPRKMRILWDQFHNLGYPPGYIPKDNIRRQEPLDWTGDHIHTNFKDTFDHLRSRDYFVEILGSHFGCFNSSNYGTLIIVDPEEEFFPDERTKLWKDVTSNGLSLIVIAEWYNLDLMKHIKFFDENTKLWWTPDTGGSNIPALNDILKMFNISFSSQVMEGTIEIGNKIVQYNSGTTLSRFPDSESHISRVLYANKMKDIAAELLGGESKFYSDVPILGLYAGPRLRTSDHGRVSVFGDSNCLDMTFRDKDLDCLWLLDSMLQFSRTGYLSEPLSSKVSTVTPSLAIGNNLDIPIRYKGNRLHKFSSVIKSQKKGVLVYKSHPLCLRLTTSNMVLDTISVTDNTWFEPQPLLKRNDSRSLDIGFKDYSPHTALNLDQKHPNMVRNLLREDELVSPQIFWLYIICVVSCCGIVLYWFCRRIRPKIREIRPIIPVYRNLVFHG